MKTKALTTSEAAQLIKSIYPFAAYESETMIFGHDGGFAIYAEELESGCSKVIVNNNQYSKMSADEKREAVDFIKSAKLERHTEVRTVAGHSYTFTQYYIQGSYEARLNSDRLCEWQKELMKKQDVLVEAI